jgi:[ribosomal protein S5]-alanine N-acetyltransferase
MNKEISIRLQKISDAKRFYEILTNPNFIYFGANPKSISAERDFLKKNVEKTKNNIEHNFTILFEKEIVGGIGVKINQHRKFIGEIGYFLDEKYWGRGITTKAVKLIEKYCVEKLKLRRLEIVMVPKNKGSKKVAEKNDYKKEGLLKKAVQSHKKNYPQDLEDVYLYAKIVG